MNTNFEHRLETAEFHGELKTKRNIRYYNQFFDLESPQGRLMDGSEKP